MTAKEVNRISMDILNVKNQIENRKEHKDLCDTCNRESCRYCDGRSKYKADKEQAAG